MMIGKLIKINKIWSINPKITLDWKRFAITLLYYSKEPFRKAVGGGLNSIVLGFAIGFLHFTLIITKIKLNTE